MVPLVWLAAGVVVFMATGLGTIVVGFEHLIRLICIECPRRAASAVPGLSRWFPMVLSTLEPLSVGALMLGTALVWRQSDLSIPVAEP
jgi:hypothetical protein